MFTFERPETTKSDAETKDEKNDEDDWVQEIVQHAPSSVVVVNVAHA